MESFKQRSLSRVTVLSLVLLSLSYLLVGWQLAVNDILIFLAVSSTVFAIVLAGNENPWIGGILGNLPQILLFAFSTSILITLITTVPVVLMVIIIPTLTTFLSWKELQLSQVNPNHARKIQLAIIGCSLLIGELLDLFVIASPKN